MQRAVKRRLADVASRLAAGRAAREDLARAAHAAFDVDAPRRNVVKLIEASNAGRIAHLVPIRIARMLHSPFAFLRGAASIMAWDLGRQPHTGIATQLCGDCHLNNFGGFASPERALLFGINDFDETLPGPFEWDVKRLAASFVVAMRDQRHARGEAREAALRVARSYREHMLAFSSMKALDLWYQRIELGHLEAFMRGRGARRRHEAMMRQAVYRTAAHAFPKLVEVVRGRPRIRDHPPLVYHPTHIADFDLQVREFWEQYVASLPDERRVLIERYELVDVAVKVVGVGSVGTRCAIALLMAGPDDPMFLQFKEARRSVLEPRVRRSRYANQGQRVVVGQRLMQAQSDIFLGWSHAARVGVDFYVRQLRDMKVSLEVEAMSASEFAQYANVCGWALARAHAKAGDPALIAGYLGKRDVFDRAIAEFALAYAEQTSRDFEALGEAVKAGKFAAEFDP